MRSATFLWLLSLRLYRFEHLLDKARLRHSAHNLNAVVHHGLGYSPYLVKLGHINELRDFDHIGSDVLVFNG